MSTDYFLEPGQHFEGLVVVDNPVFASRAKRTVIPPAQRFFDKAVYAAEQCQRQGWAVTAETLRMVNSDLPIRQLADLIGTDKYLHALEQRGIQLAHSQGLSPKQNAALAVYFDMSTPATHAQKLKMAGITKVMWEGWLRQPPFAARYNELAEDILKATPAIALQRLGQHVDQGNMKAIELTLEMTGRHDRRKDSVDPNALLMEVFAVLDEFVDADVMRMISERLKARMGGGAPAPTFQIMPTAPPTDTIIATPEEG